MMERLTEKCVDIIEIARIYNKEFKESHEAIKEESSTKMLEKWKPLSANFVKLNTDAMVSASFP